MQGPLLVPVGRLGVRCRVLLAGRSRGLCFAPDRPDGQQATGLKRDRPGLEELFEAHLLHQWRAQQPQRVLPPACQGGAQTPASSDVEQVTSAPDSAQHHTLDSRALACRGSGSADPVSCATTSDQIMATLLRRPAQSCSVRRCLRAPHLCVSRHHLKAVTR